jgi:hypothetical protein
MIRIAPDAAAAYIGRWRAVTDHHQIEVRTSPVEQRLQQLSALFESRSLFPRDAGRDLEAQELHQRWNLIRSKYRDAEALGKQTPHYVNPTEPPAF